MSLIIRSLCAVSVAAPFLIAPPALAAELTGEPGAAVEVSHRRDVVLHSHFAVVTDTHVFATLDNETRTVTAAYQFSLPADVAIVGVRVSDGARDASSVAIDAAAAVRLVPHASGQGADRALLRSLGGDESNIDYQLVVHPIAAGAPLTVSIEWVRKTQISGSLVTAFIPMRGEDPKLRGTALYASHSSDKSIRLEDLRVEGVLADAGEVPIDQGKSVLAVQARADFGRLSQTIISSHATKLSSGLYALAIACASPPPKSPTGPFENVVIVVDGSLSVGTAGLAAAAELAETIFESAKQARIEAVIFDRAARPVLGALGENTAESRALVAKSIREHKAKNGSDLRAALDAVAALRGRTKSAALAKRTAIIVIGDGQWPAAAGGDELRAALGDAIAAESIVFAVDVASGANPLPAAPAGALADLVAATGGRTFSVRDQEAAKQAPEIASQLAPAPQLAELSIEVDGAPLAAPTPAWLANGGGFFATVLWAGAKPPRSIRLIGTRSGAPEQASATPLAGPGRKYGAALALRDASPESLTDVARSGKTPLVDRLGEPASAARSLAAAATVSPVVSDHLSLVVPDGRSRFARERLAYAQKWGTELYLRAPTDAELISLDLGSARPKVASARKGLRRLLRGGGLDRSTLGGAIRAQLFRPVRNCYEKALRRSSKLQGTLRVRFEIARGELLDASIALSDELPSALRNCVLDAAYELNVPASSADEDTTYVVNYPFHLRPSKTGASVERGADDVDPDEPLDGM